MSVLSVVVGLLAVMTLGNLFLLIGVVRRLRAMAGGGPAADTGVPSVGDEIDGFSVAALDGTTVTVDDIATRRCLAVFLSPGCAPCKETAARLARGEDGLPDRTYIFMQADAGDPDAEEMIRAVNGAGTVALVAAQDTVERAFQVTGYPTTILVDDGRVAAASFSYDEVLTVAHEALVH